MNGSFIPDGVEAEVAPFLNHMQIREKHNLTAAQYRSYEKAVMNTKVQDALWRWPDGPHRDILNYLVMTSH